MIYGLNLEGFQSFGLKQELDLKPLTLIFGPNSVGKSAIGRSLRLLSQSQKAGGGLQYSGTLVQMGGFADASHQRRVDDSHFIRIGVRLAVADSRGRDDLGVATYNIDLVFSPHDPEKPAWVSIIGVRNFRTENGITAQGSFAMVLSRITDPSWSPDPNDNEMAPPIGPLAEDARILALVVSGFETVLEDLAGVHLEDGTDLLRVTDEIRLIDRQGRQFGEEALGRALEEFRFRFDRPSFYRGLNLLPALRKPPAAETSTLHSFVNDLLQGAAAALNESIAQFQYIGPLRNVASEYVRPSSQWVSLLPDASNLQEHLTSLSEDEFKVISEALKTLTDGHYSLSVETLDETQVGAAGFKQVVLLDNFLNAKVTLSNAGTGISQVLPIVAGLLSMTANIAKNRRRRRPFADQDAKDVLGGLLFVEQPELHLHPAMQARLGDYLIDNSSDGLETNLDRGRGKPIVVCETHSEALVMRVLSRIKAGSLSPDNVAIYFVDRFPDWDSSHAIRMKIDAEGNFTDPWPLSFSDVRNKERFGW